MNTVLLVNTGLLVNTVLLGNTVLLVNTVLLGNMPGASFLARPRPESVRTGEGTWRQGRHSSSCLNTLRAGSTPQSSALCRNTDPLGTVPVRDPKVPWDAT